MKNNGWILTMMTVLILAMFGGIANFAESPVVLKVSDKKMVVIIDEEKPLTFSIADLEEGESQTLSAGDHTIIVTRQGDSFTINIDGEEILDSAMMLSVDDSKKIKVIVHKGDGEEEKHVMVYSDKMVLETDDESGSIKVIKMMSSPGENQVMVMVGDDKTVLNLEDLADGETRTFEEGDHVITVTRHGDTLSVSVDGEEMPETPASLKDGKKTRIYITKKMGDGEAEASAEKFVWISKDKKTDGKNDHVIVLRKGDGEKVDIEKFVWKEKSGEGETKKLKVFISSENNEMVIHLNDETVTLSLDDFEEGISQTITMGDHTLIITRSGDQFKMNLDGKDLK